MALPIRYLRARRAGGGCERCVSVGLWPRPWTYIEAVNSRRMSTTTMSPIDTYRSTTWEGLKKWCRCCCWQTESLQPEDDSRLLQRIMLPPHGNTRLAWTAFGILAPGMRWSKCDGTRPWYSATTEFCNGTFNLFKRCPVCPM